jgi:hypothetical protein
MTLPHHIGELLTAVSLITVATAQSPTAEGCCWLAVRALPVLAGSGLCGLWESG